MVFDMQLMRVYGALMWSLGKVLNTPEVMRVYIGCVLNAKLFIISMVSKNFCCFFPGIISGFLLFSDCLLLCPSYYFNSYWTAITSIAMLQFKTILIIIYSSFNDKPVNEAAVGPLGKELFEREQDDLLSDLKDVPKKACDRRVILLICDLFQTTFFLNCF